MVEIRPHLKPSVVNKSKSNVAVVVLPLVPVTPTTANLLVGKSYQADINKPKQSAAFSTLTTQILSGIFGTENSQSIQTAPFEMAF